MLRLILLFTILVVIGCGSRTVSPELGPPARTAIVFVPGYQGTSLVRTSDESTVWVSAYEALFGDKTLRLPLEAMGFGEALDLKPGPILEHVSVVPGIYGVPVYGPILNFLRDFAAATADAKLVEFAYDWRRDLIQTIEVLDARVRALRAEGFHVVIFAHSMGALLTGYFLRYGSQPPERARETWEGAELVDAVVTAAAPFRGAMRVFSNMQYGSKTAWNRSLMQANAISSFPSSYYLLPSADYDVLLNPELVPERGAILNPKNWDEQGWGLLRATSQLDPKLREARFKFTAAQLQRSDAFHRRLLAPIQKPPAHKIPLLNVVATGSPCLARGIWQKKTTEQTDSVLFQQAQFDRFQLPISETVTLEDGDGTVTAASAQLPPAFAQAFAVSSLQKPGDHRAILDDDEVRSAVSNFFSRRKHEAIH